MPELFTIIGATVGAVAGIVLAPIAAPAVLGIVGFGAAGPVAGGIAAGIQAGIGNVVAGSLFAGAQSVAAGGHYQQSVISLREVFLRVRGLLSLLP
ncbi:hypothetical protein B0H13DRAFT_1986243, partial [Mycena leptocephala]